MLSGMNQQEETERMRRGIEITIEALKRLEDFSDQLAIRPRVLRDAIEELESALQYQLGGGRR